MRRRIEELADRFEEFVSEDAHAALVITCGGEAVGLLGAAVDLTEQRGSVDISLASFQPFSGSADFLASITTQLEPLIQELGGPPLDSTATPSVERLASRLGELVLLARRRGDVRVVVWACPSLVAEPGEYVALAVSLVRASCGAAAQLRLAFRETTSGELAPALRRSGAAVLEVALDVGPRALRDGLAEDAASPTNDVAVRAAAATTAAMADAAAGQTDRALAQLSALADLHRGRADVASEALCTILAGTVFARCGRLGAARLCLAHGLTLATDVGSPVLAMNATVSLGELAMQTRDPDRAEAHFDLAARLGAQLGQPAVVAYALLRRGAALEAGDRLAPALEAFVCAAAAADRARANVLLHDALAALVASCRRAGRHDDAARFEARRLSVASSSHCAHGHGGHAS